MFRSSFGCDGTKRRHHRSPAVAASPAGQDRGPRPTASLGTGDSDALFAEEVHSFLRGKLKASRPRSRSNVCQPRPRLWIQEFESSVGSHAVWSPDCIFPRTGKRPCSRRLGCPARVSRQQFQAFRYFGRGFRAPVSARFFPISVFREGRLVRLLPETGLRNARRVR
jgi:hypothetical protein